MQTMTTPRTNGTTRVLLASLVGTTIEFFDFYIYATAAVLVFPKLFFPKSDPAAATLQSFATFAVAFYARPFGAALFGHFGDRIGRKATLVAALATMGLSTFAIGTLPGYEHIGILAPTLLALCRFGQGLGLGGEWGGAVLLATENAPAGKRGLYGVFPQLGAPVGFLLSGGTFLLLSANLSNQQFIDFGWRIPFLASAVLVIVGLYVRLKISETAVFAAALTHEKRERVPIIAVFRECTPALLIGTVVSLSVFVLFYLMTVFALSWGTSALHFSRNEFLAMQLLCMIGFAAAIPLGGWFADRGRRLTLIGTSVVIVLYGFVFAPLFSAGRSGAFAAMALGLIVMGFAYGPLGTVLSELFPTRVRYTGSSMTFNLAGIFGASLAPYIATYLAKTYGLQFVGYYLSAAALLSLVGLLFMRETKDEHL